MGQTRGLLRQLETKPAQRRRSIDAHNIPCYPTTCHCGSRAKRASCPGRPARCAAGMEQASLSRLVIRLRGVRVVDRFVSNVTLRLDAKGRVSIPASFRLVLGRDGFDGLYCYPALDRPAIDAGGNALMAEIEALIARYAPFSEAREQLALSLYGTSETLKIDGEGRVTLSETLKTHAGIADAVTFAGLGHKFQIWEPGRFRSELAEATQKVRALKAELGSQVAARDASGARE